MKITDIQCIHIQIPKVSTNIIGGSVSYEGNPIVTKNRNT